MEKCYSCYYREKWGCQGGCLTYAIMKDHGQSYTSELLDPCANTQVSALALGLAEDVRVFHYETPKATTLLRKTSANLEFEIDEVFLPILPLLDGQRTLDEIISALPVPAPFSGSSQLRVFMYNVLAESVPDLLRALLRQGFLQELEKRELQPEGRSQQAGRL
jgi:hypothetical protein